MADERSLTSVVHLWDPAVSPGHDLTSAQPECMTKKNRRLITGSAEGNLSPPWSMTAPTGSLTRRWQGTNDHTAAGSSWSSW